MSNKWHDKARKDERGASTGPTPEFGVPLGIITKSHPILATQGFPENPRLCVATTSSQTFTRKSRVCFCGKRKIDKLKNRSVVYNPNTERAYFENVQRCGSIWDCKVCAKRSLKHVEN